MSQSIFINMKSIFIVFLFFLIFGISTFPQKITVSGYVTDAGSGERLINAAVYEKASLIGSVTNTYGFFSIQLTAGYAKIIVSYLGYESSSVTIWLSHDTIIDFSLVQSLKQLEAVTVTADINRSQVKNPQMSMIDIPVEKFLSLPVLFGEADVLKVIQLLPGIQSGTEGTAGIYVRGGGPDQNLFLLDGVPIYNASHLFGFMSVFNPDAVKSVQLYKGGFPARYGERLSSVVDIRMKEGNEKETHGNFTVGLISSKLSVEGPIKKDTAAYIISARRTYADVFARPIIALADDDPYYQSTGGYYFYDLNGKLNYKFSEKSRVYLSAYMGRDKAFFRETSLPEYTDAEGHKYKHIDKTSMGWGNIITALRWNYLLNNKLFSNSTLTFSDYKFDISYEFLTKDLISNKKSTDFFRYFSGINDFSAKVDFDFFPSPMHTVKFGTAYTFHNFKPGITSYRYNPTDNSEGIDTTFGDVKVFGHEFILYAEDNIELSTRFNLNAGLRSSIFNVQDTTYISLQPRISFRFMLSENLSIKAAYSRMTQFVHLLTTSAVSLPTDLWLPVTKHFEPPVSDQYAVGSSFRLPWKLEMTIEGFYKTMDNLIEYKEGASFGGSGQGWESKVEKGCGWAYGTEFLLEKNAGKTTGWIGYTLSWTERQFKNLNYGRVFPAKYDRRHDISVTVTHKFNNRVDIGLVWVYGTGNTATLGIMKYNTDNSFLPGYYNFSTVTDYPGRNNYRTPAYHRLDASLNLHKQKKNGVRTWNFSVYNAYCRMNPFFIYWGEEYITEPDESNPGSYKDYIKPVLKKVSLFPVIPSVSYSFIF